MRVSIIDRYLFRSFILMFFGMVAVAAMLLVLTEVLQRFNDIATNQGPMDKVLLYFVFFLPYRLIQVLPLATIISVLFSVGILAHNREMLAITASGLGPVRVAASIIVAGLAISVVSLLLATFLVPASETIAQDIRRVYIEGRGAGGGGRIERENAFARGEANRFFVVSRYVQRRPQTMIEATILDLDRETGRPLSRLTATTATLIAERDTNRRTLWRLEEPIEYAFDERGRLQDIIRHGDVMDVSLEPNLHRHLATKRKPEEMGAWELYGYIQMLEMHDEDTGLYWTDFWLKLLFPFASLIFIIGGFAFAMRAQVGSMVIAFAEGIFFAIIFYAVISFTQAIGHGGGLSPLFSVFLPLLGFAALAVHLLRRSAYNMT